MAEIKLTANDPQPPPATVVRDDTGCRWYRERGRVPCGWVSEHDSAGADPESWTKVAGNYGPVIVLRLPDGVETWPPKPKESAPVDLAAQIRKRLENSDPGWWEGEMKAALLAVLDVHKPERHSIGAKVWHNCASCRDTDWNGPEVPWPCETVEAIAKALGIEVDGG